MGVVMIHTIVISDVGLLREALVAVLSTEPDLHVTGVVGADHEALGDVERLRPDVAVVDLDPPGRCGLDTIRKLVERASPTAAVALTERPTPEILRLAIAAGARGLTTKDQPPAGLAEIIRRVAKGDRMLHPATALATLATLQSPLTDRESDVLRLAAQGLPSRSIALQLCLSDGTVRNYLSGVLRKMGCVNRLQAAYCAQERGWL
jgi:two-component system response regulator DesR